MVSASAALVARSWVPTARREVRKTVTVVFCDVSGSTALGERLDPEAMRRTMGRYFEETRLIVKRHRGTVEKFFGDAVIAVFGIPVAHEDDALRAVRAVAEIRTRLAALGEELSVAALISDGSQHGRGRDAGDGGRGQRGGHGSSSTRSPTDWTVGSRAASRRSPSRPRLPSTEPPHHA